MEKACQWTAAWRIGFLFRCTDLQTRRAGRFQQSHSSIFASHNKTLVPSPPPCRWFANTNLRAEASIMSPRPILKRSEAAYQQSAPTPPRYPVLHSNSPSHAVHFPPSPTLTRTFSAYSPSAYDRSPIVVSPNACALPERGCPGRTYTLDESASLTSPKAWNSKVRNGRHLHPRAVAAYRDPSPHIDDEADDDDEEQRTPTHALPVLPSLIPDLSSESDESDCFTSPPEHALYSNSASYYNPMVAASRPPIPFAAHRNIPYSDDDPQAYFAGTPTALSFLPHPPSPSDEGQKARRRKQRSRDRSRSRDERQASSDPRRGTGGSYKSLSLCRALTNCSLEGPDDGCLGGF